MTLTLSPPAVRLLRWPHRPYHRFRRWLAGWLDAIGLALDWGRE